MFGGEDIIFIQCLGLLFVSQLIMGVGIRSVFQLIKFLFLSRSGGLFAITIHAGIFGCMLNIIGTNHFGRFLL